MLPSAKSPVAVKACVVPSGIEGDDGATAMETNGEGVTVRVVVPLTVPTVAVIVVDPVPIVLASPVALTVAIDVEPEDQEAVLVKSCVVESV